MRKRLKQTIEPVFLHKIEHGRLWQEIVLPVLQKFWGLEVDMKEKEGEKTGTNVEQTNEAILVQNSTFGARDMDLIYFRLLFEVMLYVIH